MKQKTIHIYNLIKFGQRMYMESLYNKGELCLNTVEFFKKTDNETIRDIHEGDDTIHQGGWLKLFAPDTNELIFDTTAPYIKKSSIQLWENHGLYFGNIYSMFCITRDNLNPNKLFHDDILKFGDCCVIITDVIEFINRIEKELSKQGLKCTYRPVTYKNYKKFSRKIDIFTKDKLFKNQKEFRFFVKNNKNEKMFLNIGSIKDIAILINDPKQLGIKLIEKPKIRTERIISSTPIQCRTILDNGILDFTNPSSYKYRPLELSGSTKIGRGNREHVIVFYGIIMKKINSDIISCFEVSNNQYNVNNMYYIGVWGINNSCNEIHIADCSDIIEFRDKNPSIYLITSEIVHDALVNNNVDMVVYHSIQQEEFPLVKEVCTVLKPSFVDKHMSLLGVYCVSFKFPTIIIDEKKIILVDVNSDDFKKSSNNEKGFMLQPVYHKYSKVINGKIDFKPCPKEWENDPFNPNNHPINLMLPFE